MIPEDGVLIQDNLLKQLNEFIGKVSRHEGLYRHGNILWILSLTEGSLNHLVNELATVSILWVKDNLPEFWFTAPHKVAGLTLEE